MLANTNRSRGWLVLFGLLLGAGGSAAQIAGAQQGSDGGYTVTEDGGVRRPEPTVPAESQQSQGPVRLARFSYVKGNVTWRTDENTEWSSATLNLPLRQGAQIWVSDGGRAEIQFDDGSLLRLGTGAVVTLQTLYSDADGEFTELKMTDGLAYLHLRHDHGVYQVNTPLGSVKAAGPAGLRIGVGNGLEVALRSGRATIEGSQGKADLRSGDFLDLSSSSSPYTVRDLPTPDSWDRWNQDRNEQLARAESRSDQEHLPANVAIVANNLDDYGTWRDDSQNGWVWCPRVTSADWRPYNDGHWTWVNPFGWTWVSNEAWGWAPYHYGTWVSRPYGWAWCPGPVNQYWSPAVVHFSEYGGNVGWCPLAPSEVRYPSGIALGFRSGNWATYFSIGAAAVYYPTAYGYCAPRVYNTTVVNRVTYVNNVTNVTNVYNGNSGNSASFNRLGLSQESYAANNNTYLSGRSAFIPMNSRLAAGVTSVSGANFGGRGAYTAVPKADTALFTRGRVVAAPEQGRAPLAGPIGVRPTQQSMTPTRTFTPASQTGPSRTARPVYRAAVMSSITQNSAPMTPTGRVVATTQTGFVRPNGRSTAPGAMNRNDRGVSSDGSASGSSANGNTSAQLGTPRIQVQPRGNGSQSVGNGRTATGQSDTGITSVKRSSGAASSSAAEAAAQARASLGITGRSRPSGSSTEAGSTGRSTRPTGNSGSSSGGSGGSSTEKAAPAYTPRPAQQNPPRTEAPRNEQPRNEPSRAEAPRQPSPPPARTEPPRSEAPHQTQPAPARTETPRVEPKSNPPARETEKAPASSKGSGSEKSSDTGSKGSSDPTNRGRPGRD